MELDISRSRSNYFNRNHTPGTIISKALGKRSSSNLKGLLDLHQEGLVVMHADVDFAKAAEQYELKKQVRTNHRESIDLFRQHPEAIHILPAQNRIDKRKINTFKRSSASRAFIDDSTVFEELVGIPFTPELSDEVLVSERILYADLFQTKLTLLHQNADLEINKPLSYIAWRLFDGGHSFYSPVEALNAEYMRVIQNIAAYKFVLPDLIREITPDSAGKYYCVRPRTGLKVGQELDSTQVERRKKRIARMERIIENNHFEQLIDDIQVVEGDLSEPTMRPYRNSTFWEIEVMSRRDPENPNKVRLEFFPVIPESRQQLQYTAPRRLIGSCTCEEPFTTQNRVYRDSHKGKASVFFDDHMILACNTLSHLFTHENRRFVPNLPFLIGKKPFVDLDNQIRYNTLIMNRTAQGVTFSVPSDFETNFLLMKALVHEGPDSNVTLNNRVYTHLGRTNPTSYAVKFSNSNN